MKVGLIGFGKMGSQIAQRLIASRHQVVTLVRHAHSQRAAKKVGAQTASDYGNFVAQLGKKPIVWLTVPADQVDNVLTELLTRLPKKSIIIDGGNSDYRLTLRRAKLCKARAIDLVDAGISGGIHGLKNGFSIMIGGALGAFKKTEPLFKVLAQKQGYAHFGPSGAGHYVKMVHNAVEYGMMESYAEGYQLLKAGKYKQLDLAKVAQVWQHGSVVVSWLNSLNAGIFKANPRLKGIDGYVAESGEARWALETAKQHKIDTPAIRAAMAVRLASQSGKVSFATKLLAAMRNAFGGH